MWQQQLEQQEEAEHSSWPKRNEAWVQEGDNNNMPNTADGQEGWSLGQREWQQQQQAEHSSWPKTNEAGAHEGDNNKSNRNLVS